MLVTKLKPDSVLTKIGVVEGDKILDINGFDFADPDEAVNKNAYAHLREAKRLYINLLRDGVKQQISVTVKRR